MSVYLRPLSSMDVECFINAVRARAPLWDQRSKQYHNRDLTSKLWEEVAKELKITKDVAKKKWKSLRDVFRAELKKLPKTKSGDETPSTFTSSWTFFKNMLFVKDQMHPRKLTGSVTVSDTDVDADIDTNSQTGTENYDEETVDMFNQTLDDMRGESESITDQQMEAEKNTSATNTSGGNPSERANFKAPVKRKHDSDMDAFLQLEKEKLQLFKRSESTNNDDDYHFLMSFLPSMKKMTYSTKMLFRLKMQELLYKCTVLEQRPYPEMPSYPPHTSRPLFSPTGSQASSENSVDYQLTPLNPVSESSMGYTL